MYKTNRLKIYKRKVPITVLLSDQGFFTDEANRYIGKIVAVYKCINEQNEVYIEPKYTKVIQHFPGGVSWTWIYSDGGYIRE